MTFSIFFWNVWYRNQVQGDARYDHLLSELKRLTDQHQPDFIALNEVVRPSQAQLAPVVEYTQKLGYPYSHCANMAQLDNYWMSGVVLCSRLKLSQKQNIVISKNGYAAKRGYPDLDKEVISAQATLAEGHVLTILVAHPPDTLHAFKDHWVGMNSLDKLVHSETYSKNTILVGDMNEWRLIPRAFRHKVADVMHPRTGSFLHPTWRYDAHRFAPLRLNLDYVYWNKQSDFVLKDFKILTSNVSDHQPLLATFNLVPLSLQTLQRGYGMYAERPT
jgi:endonuclease/exonuclease/phosphatase family metal-dependent hydrolase